jgi:hypothetical protein
MSKFEELCQIYATARRQSRDYRHSCQDFADFLVHRMNLYFQCPIETGEMHLDDDANLHLETALTLYENPSDPTNSDRQRISFPLSIRKKVDTFIVSVFPYGNEFAVPRDDLNKLDALYEYMADRIKRTYEDEIQLFTGEIDYLNSFMPF